MVSDLGFGRLYLARGDHKQDVRSALVYLANGRMVGARRWAIYLNARDRPKFSLLRPILPSSALVT